MRLEELSLLGLSRVELYPVPELPSRLSRIYACNGLNELLRTVDTYLSEYGAYWFEAIMDDLDRMVERGETIAENDADVMFESIRINAKSLRGDLEGVAEAALLGSLAMLPEFKGITWKEAVTISLELHVRRKYRETIEKCLNSTYLSQLF